MGGGFGFGYGCATFEHAHGRGFPECGRAGGPLVLGGRRGSAPTRVETRLGSQPLSRVLLRAEWPQQQQLASSIRYSPVFGYYQAGTSRTGPFGFESAPVRYQSGHPSHF